MCAGQILYEDTCCLSCLEIEVLSAHKRAQKSWLSAPCPAPGDSAVGSSSSLLFGLNWWEHKGELGLVSLPDTAVPELPLACACDAQLCQAPWAAGPDPAAALGVARAARARSQHPVWLPAGGTELGSPPGGRPHIWGMLRAQRGTKRYEPFISIAHKL